MPILINDTREIHKNHVRCGHAGAVPDPKAQHQLAENLCAPHKAFHKLQLIVLVGLDFCKAHAGVRRRRRCDFSETPPPIHLATADKPASDSRFTIMSEHLASI